MESIGRNFKIKSDVAQPSSKAVVKADPIFAEAINPGSGKDQASPAPSIFYFFVATPNSPGQ
jgi:hypothetical protein